MLKRIIWQANPDWNKIILENESSDIVITNSETGIESLSRINQEIIDQASIIHSGLRSYNSADFVSLFLASQEWLLLDPACNYSAISWKATGEFIFIKEGVLSRVNIEKRYKCKHFVLADIAFQVLKGGGVVYNFPGIVNNGIIHVTPQDLDLFVKRNFGKKSNLFYSFFGKRNLFEIITHKEKLDLQRVELPLYDNPRRKITGYTAIIPTLHRYDYLNNAINSLLSNPFPPDEIIVVDQTPRENRIPGYYDQFPEMVQVHFLDQPGQATARNLAIKKAIYDWIFFFDDDSVAWNDMIKEHLYVLERTTADASTGISLAPWKNISFIPEEIRHYHVSQVLDTGNAMVRKSTLSNIGYLDTAFDTGYGVDDELGKRMYLKGGLIIFNPKSIRTHYKARRGGLRNSSSFWKVSTKPLAEFPVKTESYNLLMYYPRKFYLIFVLHRLIKSFQRQTIFNSIITIILLPYKVIKSYKKGKRLIKYYSG